MDLLDNARRRVPGLDRDADHPPAPRLDNVAANDGIFGPIRAFDENVRLDRLNQVSGRFFVKDHDAVDARQRREDFRAFPLRGDGTAGALQETDGPIGIDANQESIAKPSC